MHAEKVVRTDGVIGNFWAIFDENTPANMLFGPYALKAVTNTASLALTELQAIQVELSQPRVPNSEEVRREAIRTDATRVSLLNRLQTATNAQIDTYVDQNVTDIASARAMFKTILKLIALDSRS